MSSCCGISLSTTSNACTYTGTDDLQWSSRCQREPLKWDRACAGDITNGYNYFLITKMSNNFRREAWIEEEKRKSDMETFFSIICKKNQQLFGEVKNNGAGNNNLLMK